MQILFFLAARARSNSSARDNFRELKILLGKNRKSSKAFLYFLQDEDSAAIIAIGAEKKTKSRFHPTTM
jgi:hypothetical protein